MFSLQKIVSKFLPRVRAVYVREAIFFSFLVNPWSTIGAKLKEFIVKYNLERPWSLEEGPESHHRASVIFGTETRSWLRSGLVPQTWDVEVVSSVFCHISVVFKLADGVQASPWEKRKSHSQQKHRQDIRGRLCVKWHGPASFSQRVRDKQGQSTSGDSSPQQVLIYQALRVCCLLPSRACLLSGLLLRRHNV